MNKFPLICNKDVIFVNKKLNLFFHDFNVYIVGNLVQCFPQVLQYGLTPSCVS
jgi:hypothetical protein